MGVYSWKREGHDAVRGMLRPLLSWWGGRMIFRAGIWERRRAVNKSGSMRVEEV